MAYDPALLGNPLISHVLVAAGSAASGEARAAGFERVHDVEGIEVLARLHPR
jgi:hypothetical protein